MAIPLIRKAKIIFKNSTRSIRKSWQEVKEEVSLIIRNNKYSKNHPDIFALFTIIEQESNSKIFELQKDNFDKIRQEILQDKNILDVHILGALRGLLHNNKYPNSNDVVKSKIARYLHKKTKEIINNNNKYDEGLVKVLLFEFPFLINFNKYSALSALIKNNSKSSNKIIKDLLLNVNLLDFLIDEKDVLDFVNLSVTYSNKFSFMLFIRYLREQNLMHLLIQKADLKTRLLSNFILSRKGADYGSIFVACFQNKDLSTTNLKQIKIFLNSIKNMRCLDSVKYEKFQIIVKYLALSRSIGSANFNITKIVNSYIKELDHKNNKDSKILEEPPEIKKQKGLRPGTKISSTRSVNIVKQSPENYWLMNNAAYLL